MVRWGHVSPDINFENITRAVYRPDVFRNAALELGLPFSDGDCKLEGEHAGNWELALGTGSILVGPDLFMDGRQFDATQVREYLRSFEEVPALSDSVAAEELEAPQASIA